MQAGPRPSQSIPPRLEPAGFFTGLKIRPIIAGVVFDYIGTYAAMYAWIFIFVSRRLAEQGELSEEAMQKFLASPEGLLISFIIGALCTAVGGFIAGRMAGSLEVKHGAFVGAGSLILSAFEQGASGSDGSLPQWYVVVSALAIVPAGALGGYIAERIKGSSLGLTLKGK